MVKSKTPILNKTPLWKSGFLTLEWTEREDVRIEMRAVPATNAPVAIIYGKIHTSGGILAFNNDMGTKTKLVGEVKMSQYIPEWHNFTQGLCESFAASGKESDEFTMSMDVPISLSWHHPVEVKNGLLYYMVYVHPAKMNNLSAGMFLVEHPNGKFTIRKIPNKNFAPDRMRFARNIVMAHKDVIAGTKDKS